MRIKTTGSQGPLCTVRVTLEKDHLSSSQGGGTAFSEKLQSELYLASLGGGAVFHQATADKKLQDSLSPFGVRIKTARSQSQTLPDPRDIGIFHIVHSNNVFKHPWEVQLEENRPHKL